MALSKLKPLLPNFVGEGLKALKTEAMKATIAKSFIDGGLIELARDPDVIAAAVANNHVIAVPVEVEEEEDLGPVEDPTDEAAGEDFDVEAVEEEVQDAIDDEMNDMNDDEMDDMIDDHDGTIEAIAEEVQEKAVQGTETVVLNVDVPVNNNTAPVHVTVTMGDIHVNTTDTKAPTKTSKRQRTANTAIGAVKGCRYSAV